MRILLALLVAAGSVAHADCPKPVLDAIAKAFPKASLNRCTAEKEHGRDQFEARLVRGDGAKLEVDLAPDGTILQIEEAIALDKLPAAVTKAFAARYPKGKATGAEKQTAGKVVTYEIKFDLGAARKEATFDESGKFVEEE
jgi:Putative beta-lactamase-inhibitor-like, PepSY-like